MVKGLPVRLTESVDRKRRLYKDRPGKIVGWAEHPKEQTEAVDEERFLTQLPLCIYIFFPGCTWKIHEDLDPGVYPLAPVSRTWVVNEYTGIKARRTGYFIVPDFASTAHGIQGTSLDAVLCAAIGPEEKTTTQDQVAAYVSLSRAKRADKAHVLNSIRIEKGGSEPRL